MFAEGSSINDVTFLRGKGVKELATTVQQALVMKRVTMGGVGVSKIAKNCGTLFVDDP